MNDRYPGALLVSLMLHGAVAALMFLFAYAAKQARPEMTQVFELVAGEGERFAETKAPAFGDPGALKVDMPKEEPKPREVAPPEPTPVTPAPAPPVAEKPIPKPPEEKPLPKLPDYSKTIEKKMDRVEAKTKATIEKQRKVEAAKLTKQEFDKANKQKTAATPAGPLKVAKIDTKGIREGVTGGSVENDKGGAGGKALIREDGPVMDAYFSLLQQRLRAALNKPPGLSDTLVTTVRVRINADGSLSGARITKSSGSDDFDAAAMAAIAATRMPPHPNNKSEELTIPFRMKEQE
jgi:TonB family protein